MINSTTFWKDEVDAPMFKLNRGYLQSIQGDTVSRRISPWLGYAGVLTPTGPVTLICVEKPDRILVADAERTFKSDANRAEFVKLLAHLNSSFGDYAQGLSYVASFLSLTMPQPEVIALLAHLNSHESYVPGYWKHEAIKFATDAYVFQELAFKFIPDVAAHLQKNHIDPSAYCQKWFVGLCVHVLPFEHLFNYFECFLKSGYKFLMQFGLSLLTQTKEKLLSINNNPSALFGILRLSQDFIPHDAKFDELVKRIFEGVKDFNLEDINFAEMREQAFNKHLKARLESAHSQRLAAEGDEIEDCQICKDEFPDVYCKECNLKICETCHNSPPAGSTHLRAHKVKEIEEDEAEEESDISDSDGDDHEKESDPAVEEAARKIENKLNV